MTDQSVRFGHQPLDFGQVISTSLKLARTNAKTLVSLVAVVMVPISLISFFLVKSSVPDSSYIRDSNLLFRDADALHRFQTMSGIEGILSFFASLLVIGAAFSAAADAYTGGQPSVSSALKKATERVGSILWVTLLVALAVAIWALLLIFGESGVFLFLIPAAYLLVLFSLATPALMDGGFKGTKALARSRELVTGRWWKVFGIYLVGIVLIGLGLSILVGVAVGIVTEATGGVGSVTSFLVENALLNLLSVLIVTPIQVAVITVVYFDLRVRKEDPEVAPPRETPPGWNSDWG